jgi:hypothetical protein
MVWVTFTMPCRFVRLAAEGIPFFPVHESCNLLRIARREFSLSPLPGTKRSAGPHTAWTSATCLKRLHPTHPPHFPPPQSPHKPIPAFPCYSPSALTFRPADFNVPPFAVAQGYSYFQRLLARKPDMEASG